MSEVETRIFVGGLDYETVEKDLENYFGQWGPLTDCRVVRFPPPDGRSRGFGFVSFASLAAKEHCLAHNNGRHTIAGRQVDIRSADGKQQTSGSGDGHETDSNERLLRKLFVGNLATGWAEEDLRSYFSKFGTVEAVATKQIQGKTPRFCFVIFAAPGDVDRVQEARPHILDGRTLETRRPTAPHQQGRPEAKMQVKRIWIGAPQNRDGLKGHAGENGFDGILPRYFILITVHICYNCVPPV
jgi:RNA-binding protein Musashi